MVSAWAGGLGHVLGERGEEGPSGAHGYPVPGCYV